MGGDDAYRLERSKSLTRTFEALLDSSIRLVDRLEGGQTDCSSTIWIPFKDPESYLVTEHEISHWLFETDPLMAEAFLGLMISRILNRAGIRPGTQDALAYEKHLSGIIFMMANMLDDHRCAGLWGALYAGGEALLRERWHGIILHDVPESRKKRDVLAYLSCMAVGVDPPDDVPAEFKACVAPMSRAINLVEGVDYTACLGITARLVQEIMDELIALNPPKPPPPPRSGSGGQTPGKGKPQQGASRRHKAFKGQREAEAQSALKQLLKLVPRPRGDQEGKGVETTIGQLGEPSTTTPKDEKAAKAMARKNAGQAALLRRMIKADNNDTGDTGMTPLQELMDDGARKMEGRLEEARKAMVRNQDDAAETRSQAVLGWGRVSGIQVVEVTPTQPLPDSTAAGDAARRVLEQFRMQKRRKMTDHGTLHPGALLNAIGAGELDGNFFETRVRIARFELLFLGDCSGSMFSGQALHLQEQALADAVYATLAIKCKAQLWLYSDQLFHFSEPGSARGSGIRAGSTRMVQALDMARLWARESPARRAIIHSTDGFPTSLRAQNSSGDPIVDLRNIYDEIREQRVPISTLAIKSPSMTPEAAREQYDRAFGTEQYGLLSSAEDTQEALINAALVLAKSHVQRSARIS